MLPELAQDHLIFVAGGIGRGQAIAGYLEMGAAGVQLGTRFACAQESIAHPDFKKAFFRASARDAITSVQVDPRLPVIPVRALKNKGTEAFTVKQREVAGTLDRGEIAMAEAQLQIEHYWAGALRRAVIDGDIENGSLMAGQSVGMLKQEEPVAAIIEKTDGTERGCADAPRMMGRPLDLDVAIYRDRVQLTDRKTKRLADQRANYRFSSDESVVSDVRYLEDTIVRAIRQIAVGDDLFILQDPVAHVVGCETALDQEERAVVETALRQSGMTSVVFEID